MKFHLSTGTVVAILLTTSTTALAVDLTKDDVRLLDNFFVDAAHASSNYVAGILAFADLDEGSATGLGARGGAPINDKIDVGAQWIYNSIDTDNFGDFSGLGPLELSARYKLHIPESKANISAVGVVTLPIGEDDVGGDQFNFGAFVAARYPAQDNMVLTANIGLFSLDFPGDRELSAHMGVGTIFQLEPGINLIGELAIRTEEDYSAITAGADIKYDKDIRFRPALAVGLDDGAADLAISAEFIIYF